MILLLLLLILLIVFFFVILSVDSIEASGGISAIFLFVIGLLEIEIGRFKCVLTIRGLNWNPRAMIYFRRRLALRAHNLSFYFCVNLHEPFLLWDTL